MNQSKLEHVSYAKRGKTSASASPLVLVLLLIGWKSGASFFSQSCSVEAYILVPRGRAPFGQHQESRPLARSNETPVLNGFVNTIDWDQNQSDLPDLSMRRVTGSPWIADFRCWTWPEVTERSNECACLSHGRAIERAWEWVAILGADQKERGLWGQMQNHYQ